MDVRGFFDRLLGRGESAVTVPALDGAFKPNSALDEATALRSDSAPGNLCMGPSGPAYTSGSRLIDLRRGDTMVQADASIASACADGQDAFAYGLETGQIQVKGGPHDGFSISVWGDGTPILCPTALAFHGPDQLLVGEGSRQYRPSQWRHDLLTGGRSGAIWLVDLPSGGSRRLVAGLGYVGGLAPGPGAQDVIFTEPWAHRLRTCALSAPGAVTNLLENLPAYPGHLAASDNGGWWLSCFAPRNQLVEFVLKETQFRKEMMETVDEAFWICPTLANQQDFRAVLQRGGLKQLGILKPWAPTLSYGLIVHLDGDGQPTHGLHSRTGGQWHGITSSLPWQNGLLASSVGGNAVLEVEL